MSETAKVKKVFDFSLLQRVFHFAAPYKNKFFWSLFLAVFLAVISPVRPWLIQLTVKRSGTGYYRYYYYPACTVIIRNRLPVYFYFFYRIVGTKRGKRHAGSYL